MKLLSHPQFNSKSMLFMSPMSRCQPVQMHSLYRIVLIIITRHECVSFLLRLINSFGPAIHHCLLGSSVLPLSDGQTFWETSNKCQQNISTGVLSSLYFHTCIFSVNSFAAKLSARFTVHELAAPSLCASWASKWHTYSHADIFLRIL